MHAAKLFLFFSELINDIAKPRDSWIKVRIAWFHVSFSSIRPGLIIIVHGNSRYRYVSHWLIKNISPENKVGDTSHLRMSIWIDYLVCFTSIIISLFHFQSKGLYDSNPDISRVYNLTIWTIEGPWPT